MYRAFTLTHSNWSGIASKSGETLFQQKSEAVRTSLEAFVSNKIVDGGKLSAHWFPKIKADVFISHSHQDKANAITFAAWLKDNFGLEPFIDSCVWGHAAELLAIIDKEYCWNEDKETYDYLKRNDSTSHVHMILANALSEMLEVVECVFFMNTPNSIAPNETVSKTLSPWIFYELGVMRIIRRTKPARMEVEINLSEGRLKKAEAHLQMTHPVPLNELTPLSSTQLNQWIKAHDSKSRWQHDLDLLYEIAPESRRTGGAETG